MASELKHIVEPGALERFRQNDGVAHGLPAFAYIDQDYWDLEQRTLFQQSWVFAGFAHELDQPGDAYPLTVGGKPLFLLRNKRGEIKAFHNACRHRCLKLVDQTGNLGPRIRCPYHSWVYNLDGELRSTPFFGGPDQHTVDGFDPAQHSLVPVHCRVWHDWIFVNLSKDPPDFDLYVEPLSERTREIDFDMVRPIATLDFGVVQTNWKLLVENFIEPYHVQFVHAGTTDQPLRDHYTVVDGVCLGSGVDVSNSTEVDGDTLAVSSLYLTLFPNFVLGRYYPDQLGVHLNTPAGVDRTHQRRVIYATDDRERAPAEVESLQELWYKVHKEDHHMCERLQQGKASDAAADGGLLSPHWEISVRRFQELALQAVEQP